VRIGAEALLGVGMPTVSSRSIARLRAAARRASRAGAAPR
jgi:hypothetical protein